jgi:uncharacterized protein (DUF305 family)
VAVQAVVAPLHRTPRITRPLRRHRAVLAGPAVGLALVLSACGGESDTAAQAGAGTGSAAATSYSEGDVMFAQQMIPHHQQVVELAELAATKASDPELRAFAAQLQASESKVVGELTGMLTGWGKPTAMEDMSHQEMPGMASEQDMSSLASLSGAGFDRRFTQMMITHHIGASQLTMTEQQTGSSTQAKAIAAQLLQTQTEQVTQLQTILAGLT